jgi:hypothetical protein
MGRRGPPRWVVVAAVPLLIGATDPRDDLVGCHGGAGRDVPDLVEAVGEIAELGTSARWTLRFAEPLVVPDADGRPFRVDVVLRDPEIRAFTAAFYRDVNRIVRVDATLEHRTQILLLAERGSNVFNPPEVTGRTMTIQVPGRTLTEDEDLTGTSPGLPSLRWSVIVRDGPACDFLGTGRPTERLVPVTERTAAPGPPTGDGGSGAAVAIVAIVAAVALVGAGYLLRRRSS